MGLREIVRDWVRDGYEPPTNPLVSKRLVLKNLNQISELLEDDCPHMATERIKWLIDDINLTRYRCNKVGPISI